MKITNGKILIAFGIIHSLLAISPFAFGKQFILLSDRFFFKISDGLSEFPVLNGEMNYANFAAFWFFYFGLLLIPLGVLLQQFENFDKEPPRQFAFAYLIIVMIGSYMIPFSGMTFFMLPHSIYMLKNSAKHK